MDHDGDEMTIDQVAVPAGSVSTEIDRVKGSRFLVDVAPAPGDRERTDNLDAVREREGGATHHCWGWRSLDGTVRSSDDGEPRGTAGPPIAARIEASGLYGVLVVVTRYYGGTNLGRGGLIRAYGAGAAAGLEIVERSLLRRTTAFAIRHAYDLSSAVDEVVAGFNGEVTASTYSDVVDTVVAVPESRADAFEAAVTDATAGVVRPVRNPWRAGSSPGR